MRRIQVSAASIERARAMLAEGDLIQIGGYGWWRFRSERKRIMDWKRRVHTRTLAHLVADGSVTITTRSRVKCATLVPR